MESSSQNDSSGMTQEVANLEVVSETENVSSQLSEIASEVGKLEVAEGNSSQTKIADDEQQTEAGSSSSTSSSVSSESTSGSGDKNSSSDCSSSTTEEKTPEEPAKRKRKRKRKRKKKTVDSAPPQRPFLARYKKLKLMEPKILPKSHIRFDDECLPDVATSEYNLKPRIIQALIRNLTVLEDLEESSRSESHEVEPPTQKITPEPIISLKPRIIKAIIV